MANIIIETTPEEQDKVLKALKELVGQQVPVSTIADKAGLSQTRTRYVIMDLLEAKKINRVVSKAFNKHYVRYSYEIL